MCEDPGREVERYRGAEGPSRDGDEGQARTGPSGDGGSLDDAAGEDRGPFTHDVSRGARGLGPSRYVGAAGYTVARVGPGAGQRSDHEAAPGIDAFAPDERSVRRGVGWDHPIGARTEEPAATTMGPVDALVAAGMRVALYAHPTIANAVRAAFDQAARSDPRMSRVEVWPHLAIPLGEVWMFLAPMRLDLGAPDLDDIPIAVLPDSDVERVFGRRGVAASLSSLEEAPADRERRGQRAADDVGVEHVTFGKRDLGWWERRRLRKRLRAAQANGEWKSTIIPPTDGLHG